MKFGSKCACSVKNYWAIVLLLLTPAAVFAQAPSTDIWLLDIGFRGNQIQFDNPENITDRKGYDNQPHFSPDGLYVLYSSMDVDQQADIYRYEIPSGLTHRLTNILPSLRLMGAIFPVCA